MLEDELGTDPGGRKKTSWKRRKTSQVVFPTATVGDSLKKGNGLAVKKRYRKKKRCGLVRFVGVMPVGNLGIDFSG